MKHFSLFLAAAALTLLVSACSGGAPDLDDLKENSYPLVEQLLTEDDNAAVTHRLDRYILDQHPDKLTYTGTIKVTEFDHKTDAEGNATVDSTKYYRDVVITFHGTDCDKYTVTFYESN